jgi:DNA-binding Lrp family transcriptional regulator
VVLEPGQGVAERKDGSGFAEIAKELLRIGPHVNEIARRTHLYQETVRYKYNKLISDHGFALQARPNHEALGLRRVVIKVWVNESFRPYSQDIFWAMHELCYVNGFNFMMPQGFYEIQASVPIEHVEDFVEFFHNLKSIGIFDVVEIFRFDWFRNTPMRAELFNFEEGVWDFDWTTQLRERDEAKHRPSAKKAFDETDLLIIRELQEDATRTLIQVNDGLKEKYGIDMKYKRLQYHYAKHVIRKELISGYRLNWIGTRYDFVRDKPMQRKHQYFMWAIYVKGVSGAERLRLVGTFNQLPFLYCEAGGEDYYAVVAFPLEMVNEGMDFLATKVFEPFAARTTYHTIDQTKSVNFSINPELWSEINRQWKFDSQDLLPRFENLVQKIKEETPLD